MAGGGALWGLLLLVFLSAVGGDGNRVMAGGRRRGHAALDGTSHDGRTPMAVSDCAGSALFPTRWGARGRHAGGWLERHIGGAGLLRLKGGDSLLQRMNAQVCSLGPCCLAGCIAVHHNGLPTFRALASDSPQPSLLPNAARR